MTAGDATAIPLRPASRRRRTGAWLLLAVLLALAATLGWRAWTAGRDADRATALAQTRDLAELTSRVNALRGGQRSQAQRLQQAEATNRVLRDELLGITQRAALLEDTVDRLADRAASGAETLRLDEVELLLTQAQQRLEITGDLEGARRLYTLAGALLEAMDDPAHRDLRQVFAQETAGLAAVGEDPATAASRILDSVANALASLPDRPTAVRPPAAPWWRRWVARVVEVRPSDPGQVAAPTDRAVAMATLDLDITLARAAVAGRDPVGYRAALARIEHAVMQLWPQTPEREALRRGLAGQRVQPLRVATPTLGSTLAQLRALRDAPRGR